MNARIRASTGSRRGRSPTGQETTKTGTVLTSERGHSGEQVISYGVVVRRILRVSNRGYYFSRNDNCRDANYLAVRGYFDGQQVAPNKTVSNLSQIGLARRMDPATLRGRRSLSPRGSRHRIGSTYADQSYE